MSGILSTVIICVLYLFFSLSGMTLIKSGHTADPLFYIPIINLGVSLRLLIGVVLYGIGFLTFVFFVSRLKVSVVIPVVSGIYCGITVIIGYYYFNEKITIGQIFGISLVVVGTVLIGVLKG